MVIVCYGLLHFGTTWHGMVLLVTACYSLLQFVTAYYGLLDRGTACYSNLWDGLLPHVSVHDSVAHVSRDTRRGLDFELREPNPKSKSGCNVWQILWLTIVWEFPHGNEYKHIFFVGVSCWIISDRSGKEKKHKEKKHKVDDFFALFIRPRLFLKTTQPVSLTDTQAISKANKNTVLFLFKSTATEHVVCSKHHVSKRITRHSLTFLSFHSFHSNLVSNVESNVIDMTNPRCEIQRELSMVV